jgi:hypothetical protein
MVLAGLSGADAQWGQFQDHGGITYAEPERATPTISLKTLAGLLAIEDEVMQWEFAGIGLDLLAEVYGRQLEAVLREDRSTPGARKKLISWRRGVDDYIAMLEDVRRDLDEGLPLEFFVDPLQRVVVSVGERVVILSPPPGVDEHDFEQEVVERFCAGNDCDWLGARGGNGQGSSTGAGRGTWSYSQNQRLQYRVGDRYSFEFDGFGERKRKAVTGDAAVTELEQLAAALAQADNDGYPVDWRYLAENQPVSGRTNVVINEGGDYLGVRIPLLARLRPTDWDAVVRWIRQGAWGRANGGYALVIRDADQLLP